MSDGIGDTYTCAGCGGTFLRTVGETDAEQEYRRMFPQSAETEADRELVCDECWKRMGLDDDEPREQLEPAPDPMAKLLADATELHDPPGLLFSRALTAAERDHVWAYLAARALVDPMERARVVAVRVWPDTSGSSG
jgi:DNA-directed RNA polymerase subunit RPC12/RpoP